MRPLSFFGDKMKVILEKPIKELLESYAKSSDVEICGILTGQIQDDKYIAKCFHPVDNDTSKEPLVDYVMNADQLGKILFHTKLLDAEAERDFVGVFHSHPRNKGIPSQTDIIRAEYNVPFLIYGREDDVLRAWHIDEHKDVIALEIDD